MYADSPRPDLILLDLKLPKKDGSEVMAEIYADEDLARIPIVILTGTEAEQRLLESYDIPANRFLKKPMTLSRFDNVIRLTSLSGGLPRRMPIPTTPEKQIAQPVVEEEKKKGWWPFGRR